MTVDLKDVLAWYSGAMAELDAALRHALDRSDDVLELTEDDFPLPTLATRLADVERELIDGRGFVRIRGIERSAYSQDEMEVLYWGIGTHLGSPWAQSRCSNSISSAANEASMATQSSGW